MEQHQQIKDFIAGTGAQNAPIIPVRKRRQKLENFIN